MRTTNASVPALLAQASAKLSETGTKATAPGESTASAQLAKISPALAKAHGRIDGQAQTAASSLSVLGRFKSSLHDLGVAAQGLSALTAGSSASTIQSAAEKFVAAYNANVKSGGAVAADGSSGEAGSARIQRELRSALAQATGDTAGLGKLGITAQKDGTLSLDTKALGKAVQQDASGITAALAGIGKSLSDDTAKALASDSRLSSSLSHLGEHALALKQQQSAVLDVAQRMAASQTSSGNWASTLLAAYQRNA